MQISNATSSTTLAHTEPGSNAAAAPSVASTTSNSNQDSAVTISPEGAAVAAQDASSSGGADTSDTSGTSSAEGTTANPANTADVSPLKSLAYGTLGLERPDQAQENRNPFYTAGRWIAAGLTIGGIISLLV
ncbi:hypothetical protein [Paraburkholderia sp. BCC1885]|uniref:hypothetical protein n=1 Tax=Paraburkholderia sp. BCC1885 TaxID=2562669 RepID=UPI00118214C6|nr:hypothetical protein [Paraburkholderia sp. BCC1885]